jgi:hypothetical protein
MTTIDTNANAITAEAAYNAARQQWDTARAAMPEAAALNAAADRYEQVCRIYPFDSRRKASARSRMKKATLAYNAAGQRLPEWRTMQDAWILWADAVAE